MWNGVGTSPWGCIKITNTHKILVSFVSGLGFPLLPPKAGYILQRGKGRGKKKKKIMSEGCCHGEFNSAFTYSLCEKSEYWTNQNLKFHRCLNVCISHCLGSQLKTLVLICRSDVGPNLLAVDPSTSCILNQTVPWDAWSQTSRIRQINLFAIFDCNRFALVLTLLLLINQHFWCFLW